MTPIWEYVIEDSRKTARVLFGAVVFVLLIACANVANLLLSQGAARRREIAIRASIGASRRRIVRQLLVESALLGLCGGAVGILLAELGLPALAAVAPERTAFFTRIRDAGVHIDLTVLAFTAAVSLLAGMLFGILPAFKITRPSASLARRGASGRLRGVLIAAEVCLALILLAGAGLMMNSMVRLLSVDLGFRPERLLTMEVDLPRTKYANGEQQRAFFDKVLPRVASLSGVLSAGGVSDLPLTRSYSTGQIRVGGKMGRAAYHTATPGYFGTMGIPLVRGRLFAPTDTTQSPAVAIINRGLAERYWPHDDPIGKTVTVFGVRPVETPHGRKLIPMEEPLTVVGVVGDVRLIKLDGPPGAEVYRPYSQGETRGMAVVLRTAGNPESLAAAVRKEVWRADADQPITDVKSMQAVVATDVAERRFVLLLIGAFAAAAVALAAIGIFGVVSYVVRQRTQEIGIRMALGARRRNVAALVFRQTAVWVGAGIAGGIGGALALTRLLKAYLYGIQPVDAPTFALAVLALAGIAALANLVPARRAVKIDPIVALRYE